MQSTPAASQVFCNAVLVGGAAGGTLIGSSTPAARNVIAGNGTALGAEIRVDGNTNTPGVRIEGNYIGSDRNGQASDFQIERVNVIGETFTATYQPEAGIRINNSNSSGVQIGSAVPGAGNLGSSDADD